MTQVPTQKAHTIPVPDAFLTPDPPRLLNGKQAKVAIIGAGAFGSALAACALNAGNLVTLFARETKMFEALASDPLLSHCSFSALTQCQDNLADYDLILLAVPCQALRSVAHFINDNIKHNNPDISKISPLFILNAAKGIEQKTLLLPHQILKECLHFPAHIGSLSGPSFAKELRQGLMTGIVVSSASAELRERAPWLLHRPFFRVYDSSDSVGVELGGALKNVIAIVAGGVDGLRLGNNARAALITRGLSEIARMGIKMGADPLTFIGLGCMGDLILTCTGDMSRNRQFGLRVAQGENVAQVIQNMGGVIEGVFTAESAWQLAQKLQVEAPILEAVWSVLYDHQPLTQVILKLADRAQKPEFRTDVRH